MSYTHVSAVSHSSNSLQLAHSYRVSCQRKTLAYSKISQGSKGDAVKLWQRRQVFAAAAAAAVDGKTSSRKWWIATA